MILSRSTGRKVLATAVAAIVFAFLFDVTVFDSRAVGRLAELRDVVHKPETGSKLRFTATFYCKGTTTASGANVKNGMAAADPALLPIGSVIRIESLGEKYDGIYTVMWTCISGAVTRRSRWDDGGCSSPSCDWDGTPRTARPRWLIGYSGNGRRSRIHPRPRPADISESKHLTRALRAPSRRTRNPKEFPLRSSRAWR